MPNLCKKGSRTSNRRDSVPRKRQKKFYGNVQAENEVETEFVSTSSKKLKSVDYDEIDVEPSTGYVILNFLLVFNFLSEFSKCKSCNGDLKFTRTNEVGLGFKLLAKCSCQTRCVYSSTFINRSYEINRRILFIMRVLGLGLQSINMFCAYMDLSVGFTTRIYYTFLANLHDATKCVFELVKKKAVREEIEENSKAGNEPLHITVSGDGSWKKRGFSSLFGIATLIGKHTQKVVDVEIKSAYCQSCVLWKKREGTAEYDEWKEKHQKQCSANHTGSAGKMEVDAIKAMFARSEESLGVKYVKYIGDGDTKTFKAILDFDPYSDVTVQKKECVGRVQKRMGTRLRNVKKGTKGLGGKGTGKLTDKLISDLTLYYGLAIRRHPNSVADMKKAIWATFHHKCSTDDNPQHMNCPEGADSWCKWRVAEANGELESFKHEPPINKKIQNAIKPIYKTLSDDNLLERCTGNNTQNSNESLNALVWRIAPKHLHCGDKTVQIATYIAASVFNEGNSSFLKIMKVLGIAVGLQSKTYAMLNDERRVQNAEQSTSNAAKITLLEKRQQKMQEYQHYEEEEGLLYGPGIAD